MATLSTFKGLLPNFSRVVDVISRSYRSLDRLSIGHCCRRSFHASSVQLSPSLSAPLFSQAYHVSDYLGLRTFSKVTSSCSTLRLCLTSSLGCVYSSGSCLVRSLRLSNALLCSALPRLLFESISASFASAVLYSARSSGPWSSFKVRSVLTLFSSGS